MNAYLSLLRRFPLERPMAFVVAGYLLAFMPNFLYTLSLTSLRLIPAIVMAGIFCSGLAALVGLWKREAWGYLPVLFFIPALTLFSDVLNFSAVGTELIKNISLLSINSSVFMLSAWCLMQKMDAA
ncbi:hypothetical protein [Vibrio sp. SCSIO 43136]|uniref:hypothetical protein n=1 Tax=Vibrio sp. SCSIO 43136 TaxID=2819101 RepID=UPI002076102A|nr:hypothetical protein [Vibrio sp. SCSIO 43136]USD65922.1 hypothetical protein J4N39_03625 [Vibrio sp. SCSIO 43136]